MMEMFDCIVRKKGKKNGLDHGKPSLNFVRFLEFVGQTVYVAIFLILVENVLAFQDIR